jgi:hypothetical protein
VVLAAGSCSDKITSGDPWSGTAKNYHLVVFFNRELPPWNPGYDTPLPRTIVVTGNLSVPENGTNSELELGPTICPAEPKPANARLTKDSLSVSFWETGGYSLVGGFDKSGDVVGQIWCATYNGPHSTKLSGYFRAFRPGSSGRMLVIDVFDQARLNDTLSVRSWIFDSNGAAVTGDITFAFDQARLEHVAPLRFVLKAPGVASLTASTASAEPMTRQVTVVSPEYSIVADTSTIITGMTRQLFLSRRWLGVTDTISTGVAWKSLDPSVATVSADGTVQGLSPGIARISSDSYATPNLGIVNVLPNEQLRYTSITVGGAHACGLTTGGRVMCWGQNLYYQLGRKAVIDRCGNINCALVPVEASLPEKAVSVAAGHNHTCALGASGTAYCWGDSYDAAGVGDPSKPHPISGYTFTSVSAGAHTSCGITATREAWCWGGYSPSNPRMLGDSSAKNETPYSVATPTRVRGGLQFDTLTIRDKHVCGLVTASDVYCWPYNNGSGSRSYPTKIVGAPAARLIASAPLLSCALPSSGQPVCWTWDGEDRVTTSPKLLPSVPQGAFATLAPTFVWDRICGLAIDRRQYCFRTMTLDDGSYTTIDWPEIIQVGYSGPLPGIVPQPPRFTCGLTADGRIMCSGIGYGTGRGVLSGTLPPGFIAGQD